MVVRIDVSVRSDDEAGAFALNRLRIPRISPRPIFVRRALEKEIIESWIFAFILFCHLDDHHARRNNLEYFRKRAVESMDDIFAGFGGCLRDGATGGGLRLSENCGAD